MKHEEPKVYKVYTIRNEGAFGFCEGSDTTDIELEHESVCLKEDVDRLLDEKDAEIASLKAQIAEAKELSIELQKRNKAIADNAISNVESYKSKRDAEIESLKASHYAEMVDAGMRERRLNRALWIARAELCRRLDIDRYLRNHRNSWYNENCLTWDDSCVAMDVKMCKAESKCQAKAEEYK